jgi:hypothetical protein
VPKYASVSLKEGAERCRPRQLNFHFYEIYNTSEEALGPPSRLRAFAVCYLLNLPSSNGRRLETDGEGICIYRQGSVRRQLGGQLLGLQSLTRQVAGFVRREKSLTSLLSSQITGCVQEMATRDYVLRGVVDPRLARPCLKIYRYSTWIQTQNLTLLRPSFHSVLQTNISLVKC